MIGDKNKVLYDSIKRLLRRDATVHLKKIVNKSHAADLSAVFQSLPLAQQRRLFVLIDDVEQKGLLFSELEDVDLMELIDAMPIDQIVTIMESMPADDVADLIGKLPEAFRDISCR
jgi:magnesium transporter